MRCFRRFLPYVLAGSMLLNPGYPTRAGQKHYKISIVDRAAEISCRHENKDDLLETIIEEVLWGKDAKKTSRDVPILMYHEIGKPGEYGERYCVTPSMLRKHLEILHNHNHIPVSLREYINGDYKFLPPDKKPLVLTFDDATAGQFRYLKDRFGQKYIDPDCAVGILLDFNKKHPEFRLKATFFIDYVNKKGNFQVPFCQPGYEAEKINNLIDQGMEIGNHSLEHINMKKTGPGRTNNNLIFLDYIMKLIRPDYKIESLAFPYGSVPKNRQEMDTIKRSYSYTCMAWGGAAPDIDSKKFNRYRIPRIEINNDIKNLRRYVLRK